MSRAKSWGRVALLGAAFLMAQNLPAAALASTFSVTPVRIHLSAGKQIGVVTLNNPNAVPVTIQASVRKWTQTSRGDEYVSTQAILIAPPMFTMAPHGEQIVRIALLPSAPAKDESAYRLFFQQLPTPTPSGFTGVNILLRIGIPIFVKPNQPAHAQLQWSARRLSNASVLLKATNAGGKHVEVETLTVYQGSTVLMRSMTPQYLLPGSSYTWTLSGRSTSSLRVRCATDQGPFRAQVPVKQ
ncbi:MAG: fimbria/pilus periplasmic chaperone [Terriglobia bacterium]|nr:fimbria/pilus periplasmic chaperone [Terriglobia bacterium]